MAGQPQGPYLAFDVTGLQVIAEAGGIAPFSIVKPNSNFTLQATFTGSGPGWAGMEARNAPYSVQFYAEGIGPWFGPTETTWPVVNGTLQGLGTYNVPQLVQLPSEGVYKLACVVTFPNDAGVLGFNEDLIVQVHPNA
jgi:hypothetical protein